MPLPMSTATDAWALSATLAQSLLTTRSGVPSRSTSATVTVRAERPPLASAIGARNVPSAFPCSTEIARAAPVLDCEWVMTRSSTRSPFEIGRGDRRRPGGTTVGGDRGIDDCRLETAVAVAGEDANRVRREVGHDQIDAPVARHVGDGDRARAVPARVEGERPPERPFAVPEQEGHSAATHVGVTCGCEDVGLPVAVDVGDGHRTRRAVATHIYVTGDPNSGGVPSRCWANPTACAVKQQCYKGL